MMKTYLFGRNRHGMQLVFDRVLVFILLLNMNLLVKASTIHWITFINTDDPNVGVLDANARNLLYDHFINVVNSEVAQYGYDNKIYDFLL